MLNFWEKAALETQAACSGFVLELTNQACVDKGFDKMLSIHIMFGAVTGKQVRDLGAWVQDDLQQLQGLRLCFAEEG